MTKKLAIKILSTRDRYGCLCGWTSGYTEALDMAVEALKERPKGKWIVDEGQQVLMQKRIADGEDWKVCSVCGCGFMVGHEYNTDKTYHKTFHNYCPNCGADMRGEQDGDI